MQPSRSHWNRWALYLGVWAALTVLFASGAYMSRFYAGRPTSFSYLLVASAAHYFVWGLLVAAAVPLIRRVPIERTNWGSRVPLHVGLSLLFVLLDVTITFLAMPWIYPDRPLNANSYKLLLAANFYYDLWMYWTVAGLVHAATYYQKYQERELRSAQLETQLAQTQLQVLKMQMHPHFLFNTLHAISALMHKDVAAAEVMVARLSNLLRLSLENVGTQEVSLKEELEVLEHYLAIERIRFQDRLTVTMEIEPETLDVTVPNLLLQPIVENSVRHGIARRAGAGRIEVKAARQGNMLRLSVRDDGPGVSAGTRIREGVGLGNTRARLEQLYGREHVFRVGNAPDGGFEVTLLVPWREEAAGILIENLEQLSEHSSPYR